MKHVEISTDNLELGPLAPRVMQIAGGVGVLGLAACLLQGLVLSASTERFFHSWLVNFTYFLSLALGGLFFVIVQHLTRSGWSVVIRRLGEATATAVLLMAVLALPLLAGLHDLYPWSREEVLAHDTLVASKSGWLNVPFFVTRLALYFVTWNVLAFYFFRRSTSQDRTGSVDRTHDMQRWSAPATILFGVTITFASLDLLMSLEPAWYSTIFGIYYFSGAFLGFFCLAVVLLVLLRRAGRLRQAVSRDHFHDLGKLMFAFVVFWAYIAFSQYMLIWYANIPEETAWYLVRQEGPWATVSLVLLFGHFVVPFLAFLSRWGKRRPRVLVWGAVWLLAMHWLDLFWLVQPHSSPDALPFTLMDLTGLLGMGGLFVAFLAFQLRRESLVPTRDPRLEESLAFENV